MAATGFMVMGKGCLIDAFFLTCPICDKVMGDDATAFSDYHTVFDCPEEHDRLTGYMWCFGKCHCVYIVDAFTKPREITFEELPENLRESVTKSPYCDVDECDFYSVNYAKVKEFVNGDLLGLKCDRKLLPEEIEHILKSARGCEGPELVFDKDVLQKYGVKCEDDWDDDPDWQDDPEERERMFNLGYPVDSYNPFEIEGNSPRSDSKYGELWFRTDHDGVDNLLKCVSADGREFDFILSGD